VFGQRHVILVFVANATFFSVLELILPSVFHRAAREAGDDASVSFIDLHD